MKREPKDHPLLNWARSILREQGKTETICLMAWWCTTGRVVHGPERAAERTEALSLALQEQANKEMAGL